MGNYKKVLKHKRILDKADSWTHGFKYQIRNYFKKLKREHKNELV